MQSTQSLLDIGVSSGQKRSAEDDLSTPTKRPSIGRSSPEPVRQPPPVARPPGKGTPDKKKKRYVPLKSPNKKTGSATALEKARAATAKFRELAKEAGVKTKSIATEHKGLSLEVKSLSKELASEREAFRIDG